MSSSYVYSNKAATFRLVIPDAVNSFTIPNDVSWVLMQNVGANDIKFNFDDDAASDFWTIKVGDKLPEAIKVKPGSTFNTDGVGGSSTLEIVTWG